MDPVVAGVWLGLFGGGGGGVYYHNLGLAGVIWALNFKTLRLGKFENLK